MPRTAKDDGLAQAARKLRRKAARKVPPPPPSPEDILDSQARQAVELGATFEALAPVLDRVYAGVTGRAPREQFRRQELLALAGHIAGGLVAASEGQIHTDSTISAGTARSALYLAGQIITLIDAPAAPKT